MPIAEKSLDSEQELRWRAWQERGRRNDRLSEKRTKVLFSIIGLILVAMLLYHAFRLKITADSDHVEHAVVSGRVTGIAMLIAGFESHPFPGSPKT